MGLPDEVGALLARHGFTLSVAESCTGGLLGDLLTSVPGSSGYFVGGVIAYSDRVKAGLVGVSRDTLRAHGAVSEAVAGEMASGARRLFGTDLALSVTGIAGPTGGTPQKPVGLVFVALGGPGGVQIQRHLFHGDRAAVKRQSAEAALRLLLQELGSESGGLSPAPCR